mmetsp:Transcript_2051/g.5484  ORF Transcript_2051/g.5484 Transcript_2051/m.5484 type:complete len:310 (+) Transcript_2051:22-951(+)
MKHSNTYEWTDGVRPERARHARIYTMQPKLLQLFLLGARIVLKTGGDAEVRLPVRVLGEDQDVAGVRGYLRVCWQHHGHRAIDGHVLDVAILGTRLPAVRTTLPTPIQRILPDTRLRFGLPNGHGDLGVPWIRIFICSHLHPRGTIGIADCEARLCVVHNLQVNRGWVVPMLVLCERQQVRGAVRYLGAAGEVVGGIVAGALRDIADEGTLDNLPGGRPTPVQSVLVDLRLVVGAADGHRPAHLALVAVLILESQAGGLALRQHRILQHGAPRGRELAVLVLGEHQEVRGSLRDCSVEGYLDFGVSPRW